MSRQAIFNAVFNRTAQMVDQDLWVAACCCMGPQPGERLCPCRKRIESAQKAAETISELQIGVCILPSIEVVAPRG